MRAGRLAAILIGALAATGLAAAAEPAAAGEGAVVLLYHRFGEPQYPSTNISVADFEAHIAELRTGGYTVLPLEEIVSAIRGGRVLPDRSVAITIDDAFRSVYDIAWPRLMAADLPFTLFVSTGPVDAGLGGHMSWQEIADLAATGVTIGHHGVAHAHMADFDPEIFRAEIAEGSRRLATELGTAPTLFAFPFGEASTATLAVVDQMGFAAGFGQHSGVAHASLDPYYLPRFSMTGSFSGIDRLRQVADAMALPVAAVAPGNPRLAEGKLEFSFAVTQEMSGLDRVACFASGRGEVPVTRDGLTFTVATVEDLAPGRTRINCTAPAGDGRFRWLGMLYFLP